MGLENVAVLFVDKANETRKGAKYYSGKSEGSEEFDLMAFVRQSKTGKKYLSIVRKVVDPKGEASGNDQGEVDFGDL